MRRARAAGIAFAVALLAAGALVLRSLTDEPVPPKPIEASPEAPAAAPPPSPELAAPSIPIHARTPVAAPPPTPAEASAPTAIRIPGEIHYDDGSVVEDASSIGIRATQGPLFEPYHADVVQGKFEWRLEAAGTFEVLDLRIGERAYPLKRSPLPLLELKPGSRCAIVVPRPLPAAIDVVDAVTGLPLADAFALRQGDESHGEVTLGALWRALPARVLSGPRLLAAGAGRIALPASWEQAELYVGAPDHVLSGVVVPPTGGDPIRVALGPAGSFDLTVNGWANVRDGRVFASGPMEVGSERPSWLFEVDREGRAHADALAVGAWILAVREGWQGADVAQGAFEIRAGARTTLVLDATRGRAPARVVVTGSVRVPVEWKIPRGPLTWVGVDAATKGWRASPTLEGTGSGAAVEFELQDLVPGRYLVEFGGTNWWTSIVVPVGGRRVDIELPKPAVVEIVVRDAESGAEVLGANIDWSPYFRETESPLGSYTLADYDDARHAYVLAIPPNVDGYGSIRAEGFDASADEANFDLTANGASPLRREVVLRRGGRVLVKVRLDGKPFEGADVGLRREGEGFDREYRSTRAAGEATFPSVSRGTWRVSLAALPGFIAEEPKKVEVRENQTAEVVFDLRRTR